MTGSYGGVATPVHPTGREWRRRRTGVTSPTHRVRSRHSALQEDPDTHPGEETTPEPKPREEEDSTMRTEWVDERESESFASDGVERRSTEADEGHYSGWSSGVFGV